MFNFQSILNYIIYVVPAVLLCLSFHEFAHGYVSYLLGDNTAKSEGRLTLNPLAHIDPVGFLCMVFFRFGWAKPVPINPYYYKNRSSGVIMVSLAGPLSNIIFAYICMAFYKLFFSYLAVPANAITIFFSNFLPQLIQLNLVLAVFNLIPVPPLDGSKVLISLLPADKAAKFNNFARYSNIILIILLLSGALSGFVSVIVRWLWNIILKLVFFIPII